MKKLIALLLVLCVLLASCSTMVSIRTNVPGAKVKVDGEVIGKTPLEESFTNFDFADPVVEISKDGYKPVKTTFHKEFKVGAFVCGLLLWWPELLYVYGPKPVQSFELEPSK